MQCFKCGSDVAKGGLAPHILQICSRYSTRNQFQYNIPLKFKDVSEIEIFAQDFIVDNRIASLENDVNRCLPYTKLEPAEYAPFPGLLYCFSVIDLLGALLAGHATSGDTVKNSKNYMERYFIYPKDRLDPLQKIYRHKLVHLSEPKPIFFHNNNQQILSWKHDENEPSKHLTIESLPQQVNILGSLYHAANFIISIRRLVGDIKNSVIQSPRGYLADLKNDRLLQYNFVRAINQIFDPSPGV